MADEDRQGSPDPLSPENLKRAMTAFKKRLKFTKLDDDSRLGRGPFSGGSLGVYAIRPPTDFPPEVWQELCRQGRLRTTGRGLYELPNPQQDTKPGH